MSKTLTQIAEKLRDADKKVQLIYAFNGTGKTRLSNEFKKNIESDIKEANEPSDKLDFLYYNAHTEDLFFWDNKHDEPVLNIQNNSFTDWIIRDRGLDQNIIENFQRYTDKKLTPNFIEEKKTIYQNEKRINQSTYRKVKFIFNTGVEEFSKSYLPHIKISKAEESSFVWSVFFSLITEVLDILSDPKDQRSDNYYDELQYVFIDDPVSSLDDNHLIELGIDVAKMVKANNSDINFIITTHNPLFYNVISNELNNNIPNSHFVSKEESPNIERWIYNADKHSARYVFIKNEDGNYDLNPLGRKTPFSYHLQLLRKIQNAKNTPSQLKKYHLNFLRNILEKTATFLGYTKWEDLLPKVNNEPDPHLNRLLNLSSHSAHSGNEIGEVQENDRAKLIELVDYLESNYKFSRLMEQSETV